jgi:phosphotriesterase-related protein
MVREITTGVGDTGVRCGVIKVGTPKGPPSPRSEVLFRAAARAARKTGACVITHTSSLDQIAWHVEALESTGLDLGRVLISHVNEVRDIDFLVPFARKGLFLGVDKVSFLKGPRNPELADLVQTACARGLARHLILSSDIARRERLERFGGAGYSTVLRDFVPMLRSRGVPQRDIETMLNDNPVRLLTLSH